MGFTIMQRRRISYIFQSQNFRRFDPMFKGTGLRAGGNMEHEIWERYQNLDKLKKTAQRIRNNIEIKMKDLIHD